MEVEEHLIENNLNINNILVNISQEHTHKNVIVPETPVPSSFQHITSENELETHKSNRDSSELYQSTVLDESNLVSQNTEKMSVNNNEINTEESSAHTGNLSDSDSESINQNVKIHSRKNKSRLILDDSDDEVMSTTHELQNDDENDDFISDKEHNIESVKFKKIKKYTRFDSDSESEIDSEITTHNKSFNDDNSIPNKDDENSNIDAVETHQNKQKSKLAMLCDSNSEDECSSSKGYASPVNMSDDEIVEQTQDQKTETERSTKQKFKHNVTTEKVPKRMTAKEAAEQRKEIQSESQRMLRERNVSLPYHKPKCHSLQEFLQRRPKLSSAALGAGKAPPSVAIKMSAEQLKIISEKIKKREKELKEFYKSESESDCDGDYLPTSKGKKQKKKVISAKDINSWINDLNDDTDVTTKTSSFESENQLETAQEEVTSNNELAHSSIGSNVPASEKIDALSENEPNSPEKILPNTSMEPDQLSEVHNSEKNMDGIKAVESEIKSSEMTETENYNFDLDNINSEAVILDTTSTDLCKPDENPEKQLGHSKNFTYTDLDREIECFGETAQDAIEKNKENELSLIPGKSKLELLKEKLANVQPRLSGGPNELIDLESGVTQSKEVVQLMERFAKHAAVKKHHHPKHKVKLSIVTVESGGDIHEEEVAMNVDSDDEAAEIDEKPGAKLQKLREELQKQMEQKKSEMWQQKAARGLKGGQEDADDEEEKKEKDILDDEEEAELTDEDDIDEEIEDYEDVSDKPFRKSVFLDQEAEVSDNEEDTPPTKDGYEDDVDDIANNSEEDENDDLLSENNQDDQSISDLSSDVQESTASLEVGKKVLKRVIKPADDSDEDDDLFNKSILHKSSTAINLDSTVTADEDDIPPHQPRQIQTPIRPAVSQTKSISDFLTPISFLTSIHNLASATKSVKGDVSPFKMPPDVTQSPNTDSKPFPQKKLFSDSEVMDSQGTLGLNMLSQTEESSQSDMRQTSEEITSQSEPNDEPPSTQDLLGICSGEFTGVTQLEPSEVTKDVLDFGSSQSSEMKSLGQEDMIISQLLDEEELENFKKKFESPINPVSQRSVFAAAEEINGGGVIDSDEEEEGGIRKKTRKNQKRIQFSDDESSEDETHHVEEINLQDKDESDEEDIDNVGYDSEENEIDLNTEGKGEVVRLADFLENEAELSESEWGSEDEDEKDLDQLEFEAGDAEELDENQVRSDLEKIHMRRLLDDDNKEIKFIQELLFEDGEMHGTGRQRQFKWKNINLNGDETDEKKDDDEVYMDEEESEEQWRKKRHEREMFLKQKSQSMNTEDDLLCTSQLLKIGQKILQRSVSQTSQSNTPIEKNKVDSASPIKDSPFNFQTKRGSFLNRSDQVLQRVAQYTKLSSTSISDNSKRTTKHFLFQSVSLTESSNIESKKRKASEGTPNVLKKLRLNTTLSPALKNKIEKSERSKKLFKF